MQVTVEKLSPILIQFNVEVPADLVATELDRAYTDLAKHAKVRGFRPGRAPRQILSRMFGPRVAADVSRKLVDQTFPQAVSEKKVQPVNQPQIEPSRVSAGQAFSYKARFEVVPEVEDVDYAGLEVVAPEAAAGDERVDKDLETLREQHATLEAPQGRESAEDGDVLTLDVEVSIGGKIVPEANAEGFQSDLGKGKLVPELEKELVGKAIGDHAVTTVTFPKEHPVKKLRGKKGQLQVTVKDIKVRTLPELDDEFAKDLGEHETLAELRASIKEKADKEIESQGENQLAERLVQALCAKNPVPIPPSLVHQQSQMTAKQFQGALQGGQMPDNLAQHIQADSEVKVRAGILMAAIAKKESIKIGDPEIEKALKDLSDETGQNVAKLKAEYSGKNRDMLVGMILEDKVLDLLKSKAKITSAADAAPEAEAVESKPASEKTDAK